MRYLTRFHASWSHARCMWAHIMWSSNAYMGEKKVNAEASRKSQIKLRYTQQYPPPKVRGRPPPLSPLSNLLLTSIWVRHRTQGGDDAPRVEWIATSSNGDNYHTSKMGGYKRNHDCPPQPGVFWSCNCILWVCLDTWIWILTTTMRRACLTKPW